MKNFSYNLVCYYNDFRLVTRVNKRGNVLCFLVPMFATLDTYEMYPISKNVALFIVSLNKKK